MKGALPLGLAPSGRARSIQPSKQAEPVKALSSSARSCSSCQDQHRSRHHGARLEPGEVHARRHACTASVVDVPPHREAARYDRGFERGDPTPREIENGDPPPEMPTGNTADPRSRILSLPGFGLAASVAPPVTPADGGTLVTDP